MGHRRHAGHRAVVVAGSLATCLLLSGCFGSGGGSGPVSAPPTRHRPTSTPTISPTQPTSAPTTPTTATSAPSGPASDLRFSPKSDGKHNKECLTLHAGDAPAEFVYYPVLVKATQEADLAGVTTDHSSGVTVAGSWIAPAATTPGTGTLPGWPPPKILTSSSSVQWSQRVAASGATLEPTTGWYNVFLRIQVDPSVGDSTMSGITFAYHDANGDHTDTWVDHVTFSMSC